MFGIVSPKMFILRHQKNWFVISFLLVVLINSQKVSGFLSSEHDDVNDIFTDNDDLLFSIRHSRGICSLTQKHIEIGKDLLGNPIKVQIGECTKHRFRSVTSSSDNFRNDNSNKISFCGHRMSCVPTTSEQRTFYTRSGHQTITVQTGCGCVSPVCGRISKNTTFYPGTPYEKVIDVGACHGKCKNDEGKTSCKPVQSRKTYFNGPHGSEGVEIIGKCSCVSPCYRIARFDVIEDQDKKFRVLDLGECTGVCPNRRIQNCLFGGKKDANGICSGPSLYENVATYCRPSKQTTMPSIETNPKTLKIEECSCSLE